jgi:hypothetical protein
MSADYTPRDIIAQRLRYIFTGLDANWTTIANDIIVALVAEGYVIVETER